jgi:hypothetical protein
LPLVKTLTSSVFGNCRNLESIELNFASITEVPAGFFQNCAKLTSLSFPKLTIIGSNAFAGCTGLVALTIDNVKPPALAVVAAIPNNENLTIRVPAAAVDAYKAATNWSNAAIVDKIVAIDS